MANTTIAKGKWDEFKGEMRKMWGDLTNDDLERTKGNVTAIGGLVQQRFGALKDDVRQTYENLMQRYSHEAADQSESVKQDLRASNDRKDGQKH